MSAQVGRPVPVITIDGPTASGKGTVAHRVADALGFHYLDSGALYRLVAWSCLQQAVAPSDSEAATAVARQVQPRFSGGQVYMGDQDVTDAIRQEAVSAAASQVAVHPGVRQALDELQKAFRQAPGLVADGRDMGTVVFPNAKLKVFLTASVEARAQRRYKQLIEKGFDAKLPTLLQDLIARDARDSSRAVAPLKPAQDAKVLESSSLSVDEVVSTILRWYAQQTQQA